MRFPQLLTSPGVRSLGHSVRPSERLCSTPFPSDLSAFSHLVYGMGDKSIRMTG